MYGRIAVASGLVAVLATAAWLAGGGPLPAADGALARWLQTGGNALVALVVVAALVLLARQYRRWRAYRPAIHVALLLVGFVVWAALWLDPSDPAADTGSLSAADASTIRVAALGLLFAVLLTLAHHFDGDDR